jgi:hypothetical protein
MASTLARFESSGFLPLGTLKTFVCAAPLDKEVALHRRAVDARQTIRNYPGIFGRLWWSMMICALNLMEDILSTYYKCTFSAVTHK